MHKDHHNEGEAENSWQDWVCLPEEPMALLKCLMTSVEDSKLLQVQGRSGACSTSKGVCASFGFKDKTQSLIQAAGTDHLYMDVHVLRPSEISSVPMEQQPLYGLVEDNLEKVMVNHKIWILDTKISGE